METTQSKSFEQQLRDAGFTIIDRTPEELERQVDEALERVGNEMCGIWPDPEERGRAIEASDESEGQGK